MQGAGAVVDDALFDAHVDEHASFRQRAEAAEGTASFLEKRNPSWYPAGRSD